MLYLIVILISMLMIFIFNAIFSNDLTIWYILIAVIVETVAVIAIDGIFAFLIRRLPNKWFSYDVKFFDVNKREIKFYEFLRIVKWKDKILELGMFTNFSKKKVDDKTNNVYIERFILESNYGVVIHIACVIVGFLIVFIYPLKLWYRFALPVAFVNAILNILPLFILRYNLPRLKRVYKINEIKEKRQQKAEISDKNILKNSDDNN